MKRFYSILLAVLFANGLFGQCSVDLGPDSVFFCAGDAVQLDAGSDWVSYSWSTGDTTNSVSVATSIVVWVTVTDSLACTAMDTVTVVSLVPQITGGDITACVGDSITLEANLLPGFESVQSTTEILPLPDGNGENHSDTLMVSGFDNGATVADVFDALELCLTMEHSFLGDLEMMLTCPNGDSINVFNSWTGEGIGPAFVGGFGGGGTYLGDALDQGLATPGIGWQYCFSDLSSWGTLGAEHAQGNVVATTLSNGYAMTPGSYLPESPMSELNGCPINGEWIITIRDNIGVDDGFVMGWGLNGVNSETLEPVLYNWSNGVNGQELMMITDTEVTITSQMTYNGTTCLDSTQIMISEPPTISILVDSAQCNMANGSVNISTSGGSQPFDVDWSGENPLALAGGTYPVEMTDSYGCIVLDTVFNVNTTIGAVGPITGEACVSTGSQYQYSVPENDCMTFIWAVTGGSIVSGQGTQMIEVSWNDTTAGSVSVDLSHVDGYTNSFSFDLDDCTGIREIEPEVNIAPNPTTNWIRISANGRIERAELLDLAGRTVSEPKKFTTGSVQIDISALRPGTYSMNMIIDGQRVSRLISKQ